MPCFGAAQETLAQAAAVARCFPQRAWPKLQVVVVGVEAESVVGEVFARRPGASVTSVEPRSGDLTHELTLLAAHAPIDVFTLIPSGGPDVVRLASILVDRLSRFDVVFCKRRRGAVDKQRRRLLRAATLRWKPGLRDPDPAFWAARRDVVEAAAAWEIDWINSPWSLAARGVRVAEVSLPVFESIAPSDAANSVIPWTASSEESSAPRRRSA